MAALLPERASNRLTKKSVDNGENPKSSEFVIMVEPPFNDLLVPKDPNFWSQLRAKGVKGQYQFGRNVYAKEIVSEKSLIEERKKNIDIGYAIVCVAKWSNKQIKLRSLQMGSTYKDVSHPGGRVMEIISSYWMSKCKRYVLLPPVTHVLSSDFLSAHWLPEPYWPEHSIRPPIGSSHYFQRDRE